MVMMLTRHDAEESKGVEALRAHAGALLTLSSPAAGTPPAPPSSGAARRAMAAEGVFQCKTCSNRFPSFQAFDGDRTSNKRLRARMLSDPAAAAPERDRALVHECAVCGLEFTMGQALGGHMRRHRGEPPPTAAHDVDGGDPAAPEQNGPGHDGPQLAAVGGRRRYQVG